MILDTSFLVGVLTGDRRALATVGGIEADDTEEVVPTTTLQELFIGVGAS